MTLDAGSSVSAWFALGGALGGVLITGVIALVTAILNHRWQASATDRTLDWEHARQIRQERRETYAGYWAAWNALMHGLLQPEVEVRAEEIAWRQALDAMFLICGQEVLDAGIKHIGLTEARLEARTAHIDGRGLSRALNRAMREDILARPRL
ncbi:hypothetical protein ACIBG8_41240 [Nonomuraea sp. NPDC050556]|uniref:hypothetical protein n=1 Tax=Nonomuraea sp. NPDC050556 TaxID=3364369 RepID=UPI003793DDFD